ncbi:peroxisome biogenesis protein 5 [Tanacetum coccineum]
MSVRRYLNEQVVMKQKVDSSREFQEIFRKGLLSELGLALEAAVLKHPDNAEGWRLLGVAHDENDDDQSLRLVTSVATGFGKQMQPKITGRNTRPQFSNKFPDMHHQITNSNSAQTGHVQNALSHTGRLKATSSDVQEITSSCGKRRADQQLESHVFQMQT